MADGSMAYASGYGLVWQELEDLGFPGERIDDLGKELAERFASLRPDTAVIPVVAIRELRRTFAGAGPISPDLLRFRNIAGQASLADMMAGTELHRIVPGRDGPAAVVFLPDMTFRHDWFLDAVPASQVEPALRNVLDISEAAGPPPFLLDYMDREGRPVPHGSTAGAPPRRMLPAPPLQMRWYLTEMGILDHAGVNRLHPIKAWYETVAQKPFTV